MGDKPFELHLGDCRETLPSLPEEFADSVVTDPPYGLEFMGKEWDSSGVAFDPMTWVNVLRVLKPGGYMLCFGGTRTYHRLACAVEDAGFEIRDCLMWLHAQGFPKGQGCLKPAWEPILLCRKPGKRVLPLQIDECRIPCEGGSPSQTRRESARRSGNAPGRPGDYGHTIEDRTTPERYMTEREGEALGRYPANVVHDGSDEVLEAFAAFGESKSSDRPRNNTTALGRMNDDSWRPKAVTTEGFSDTGTAARFFYCAKASKAERGEGNTHPTLKPLNLVRWLVRLVTPPGGTVLDPFLGSGTTLVAALLEWRRGVGIERDPAYFEIAKRRIEEAAAEPALFAALAEQGELFGGEG
jgi:hypothetical protein